jgi:hypothetical protein
VMLREATKAKSRTQSQNRSGNLYDVIVLVFTLCGYREEQRRAGDERCHLLSTRSVLHD